MTGSCVRQIPIKFVPCSDLLIQSFCMNSVCLFSHTHALLVPLFSLFERGRESGGHRKETEGAAQILSSYHVCLQVQPCPPPASCRALVKVNDSEWKSLL